MSLWQKCTDNKLKLVRLWHALQAKLDELLNRCFKGKRVNHTPEKNDTSVLASVVSTRGKKGLRKGTCKADQYRKCESQLSSSCLKPNTISLTKIQQMKQEVEDLLATPRGHTQVHPESYSDIQPAPVWTGKSCFNKKILKPVGGDQNIWPQRCRFGILMILNWRQPKYSIQEGLSALSFLPKSQAYISHEKGALPVPGRKETSYHWRWGVDVQRSLQNKP